MPVAATLCQFFLVLVGIFPFTFSAKKQSKYYSTRHLARKQQQKLRTKKINYKGVEPRESGR